jgi:hypothetical protein
LRERGSKFNQKKSEAPYAFHSFQDQALDSVEKYAGKPLEPRYRPSFHEFLDEVEDKGPDIEYLNICYNWVSKLVNEVSSLLHESKDNLTLFGQNQADDKSKKNSQSPVE